ncbi:F-box/kelch-repeat protein At1g22040-like [Typha angustifolia]|uniref:F-box/kelch-repeat protein At1g22040-like n=1 Tax=Typha angustifolia TaxID=59011 RepID=UPI003C2E44F7
MGSLLSLPNNRYQAQDYREAGRIDANKRHKMSSGDYDEYPGLIPTLPDEISLQILARLPRIYYLNVKMVSRSWKAAITSRELLQLRRELGTTEEWLYLLTKVGANKLNWHALDPISEKWQRLPPMPYAVNEEESNKRGFAGLRMWNVVGSSVRIADFVRGWFWRRDGLDQMPFCGCAVGAVDGCLYVLGGFSKAMALNCVWRYNPCLNLWEEVSSMNYGRAFCKTGLLNEKLYVVGGVSKGRNGLNPLSSAEVFDPETGLWTQLPVMPFLRAHMLPTAFLADVLKPIATGMVSFGKKLCVPQSLYSWPFFFDIGGEIYDPETNSWSAMPTGMGDGWPARQAGTKLGVVVNGELYALEPSSSLDSGKIKKYDRQQDMWKVVVQSVPVHDFTDSEAPYLLAGFLGKLHIITKDLNNNISILQALLQRHGEASLSSSSTSPVSCIPETPITIMEEETGAWRVIAAKNFGAAELVSCQVLDV